MADPTTRLHGRIALVPGERMLARHWDQLRRYPYLPQLSDLRGHLNRQNVHGVSASIQNDRGGPRLRLYLDGYCLGLQVMKRGDAYLIEFIQPLQFRDYDRLARGVLRLQPWEWVVYDRGGDVPGRQRAFWDEIGAAWQRLDGADAAAGAREPGHDRYLELLERSIQAARQIDLASQRDLPELPYRAMGSAGEERHSSRGVYKFDLLDSQGLRPGTLVHLRDAPDLRGRVRRVEGSWVTVVFDRAVDRSRIRPEDSLIRSPSDVVYRKQADAVDVIRSGRARNPHLLRVFADHRFASYRTGPKLHGADLDEGQREAVRRALAVPDALLVLGPPGTGKTRTITRLARESAARGQRVLVSSHTNRAVDNVLERLPADVRSLRVGHNEERMSARARAATLESRAVELQRTILERTAGLASRLDVFRDEAARAEEWAAALARVLARLEAGHEAQRRLSADRDAAARRASAPVRTRLGAAEAGVRRGQRRAGRRERAAGRRWRLHERVALSGRSGWLAWLWRWLAGRLGRVAEAADVALAEARRALAAAEAELAAAGAERDRLLAADPTVRQLDAELTRTHAGLERDRADAGEAHRVLAGATTGLTAAPSIDAADLRSVRHAVTWCDQTLPLLRRRAELMAEWRAGLAERNEQLYPELIRHADVVAGTCIGVAIEERLTDVEFDLAIVDEAGQVSVPNVLVPLVRARRAVLVGDHKQLPPYVEDEIRSWTDGRRPAAADGEDGDGPSRREVGELLGRSAFERLFIGCPDEHAVELTVQRRMPEVIAEFVSRRFYDSTLRTADVPPHRDPVFRSPLALVTTADLPPEKRAEREVKGSETLRRRSYVNDAEARLIALLISAYAREVADWAVIVPYRAQAQWIARALSRELDERVVRESIGTVDSFQGGERDLVVFGFTRSNDRGSVGFLSELRRLNVAITRARRQLVLIGDATFLQSSRDGAFSALLKALVEYTREHGDARESREVAADLRRLREAAS